MKMFLAVLLCGWCGFGAAAQEEGKQRLQKAVLVEEQEHDLGTAVELYRALAGDEEMAAAVRGEAWLRLGKVLRRLGKVDEGAAALRRAVALGGDAGVAAEKLLQQDPQDVERVKVLRAKAKELVAKMLEEAAMRGGRVITGPGAERDEVAALLWIGKPAVPELVQAVESEAIAGVATQRLIALATVLLKIGGEEVARWLIRVQGSGHVAVREACVRASHAVLPEGQLAIEIVAAFAKDPSTEVVLQFLGQRGAHMSSTLSWISVEGLARLSAHPDGRVRQRVYDRFGYFPALRGSLDPRTHMATPEGLAAIDLVVRQADEELRSTDPEAALAALSFLSTGVPCATKEGREAALRYLPQLKRVTPRAAGMNMQVDIKFADHAASFVAAVEAVPREEGLGSARNQFITQLVAISIGPENPDDDVVSAMVTLVRSGHMTQRLPLPKVSIEYLVRKARPEQAALLAPIFEQIGFSWFNRVLPAPGLFDALVQPPQTASRGLAMALGWTGDARAADWLREALRENGSDLYEAVSQGALALSRRQDSGQSRELLRWLLVQQGPKNTSAARNRVLGRLVRLGDAKAAELLPRAYDLGLFYGNFGDANKVRVRGATLFIARDTKGNALHGYAEEEWLAILDRLVGMKNERILVHLLESPIIDKQGQRQTLPPAVIAILSRGMLGLLRGWSDEKRESDGENLSSEIHRLVRERWNEEVGKPDIEEAERLLRYCLESAADPLVEIGLVTLWPRISEDLLPLVVSLLEGDRPDLALRAAQLLLRSESPHALAAVRHLFSDAKASSRMGALSDVVEQDLREAMPLVVGLLQDEQEILRVEACKALARWADESSVRPLLAALKDFSPRVRIAASEALRAIRFYHEEKAHWDKVLTRPGDTAPTPPAVALIAQAHKDRPKKIRLLAIASLGTLGEPKALSFLIECAGEDDPDIVAAAEQALAKINAKAPVEAGK